MDKHPQASTQPLPTHPMHPQPSTQPVPPPRSPTPGGTQLPAGPEQYLTVNSGDFMCQSCFFWAYQKSETQSDGTVLNFGKCAIHSPQVPQPGYTRAVWPITEGLDYCGDHQDVTVRQMEREAAAKHAAKDAAQDAVNDKERAGHDHGKATPYGQQGKRPT